MTHHEPELMRCRGCELSEMDPTIYRGLYNEKYNVHCDWCISTRYFDTAEECEIDWNLCVMLGERGIES